MAMDLSLEPSAILHAASKFAANTPNPSDSSIGAPSVQLVTTGELDNSTDQPSGDVGGCGGGGCIAVAGEE
jgi:hypothetical protein